MLIHKTFAYRISNASKLTAYNIEGNPLEDLNKYLKDNNIKREDIQSITRDRTDYELLYWSK
jgi:hypothetical protein